MADWLFLSESESRRFGLRVARHALASPVPAAEEIVESMRRIGADIAILNARRLVYKRALRAHPERWTGEVRAWKRPDKVRLHPDRPAIALMQRKGGVAA